MKKLLSDHSLAVLASLAILFLAIIIGYYGWGISYLVTTENKTGGQPPASGQIQQFNLDAASKLDYRGMMPTAQQ